MATQVSLTQQAGGDLDLLDALRGRGNRIKTQQEMLREQSLAPVEIGSYNGIQGNFPISQGFNKIAQGLLATYMDSQARDKAQAAADAQRDEARTFAAGFAGTPAVPGSRPSTPEEIAAYQADTLARAQGNEPSLGRPLDPDRPLEDGNLPTPPRPPAGELGLGGQPAKAAPTQAQRTAMILQGMGSTNSLVNRMAMHLSDQDAAALGRQETSDARAAIAEQNRRDRIPPGYRVNSDGSMTAIPGGPADLTVVRDRTAATQHPAPAGFRVNPDGSMTAIPGGPADPAVVRAASAAKSQGHPIPTGDRTKLVDAGSKLSELDRLGITFEDKYGGFGASFVGDITNTIGRNTPGESPRADWWQGYQSLKNVVRNDQFGAALTKTEKAEFEKADINPGMSADTIRNNLARQSAIVRGALERRGRSMLADGYKLEAVQDAVGASIDFSKPAPKPPPASGAPGTQDNPISVKTLDEALKLPPGTWITRPDGTPGQVPPQ